MNSHNTDGHSETQGVLTKCAFLLCDFWKETAYIWLLFSVKQTFIWKRYKMDNLGGVRGRAGAGGRGGGNFTGKAWHWMRHMWVSFWSDPSCVPMGRVELGETGTGRRPQHEPSPHCSQIQTPPNHPTSPVRSHLKGHPFGPAAQFCILKWSILNLKPLFT